MRLVPVLCLLLLGGCAIPLSSLEDVAERCKERPQPLPKVKKGDDLVKRYGELQTQYAQVASRLRCTQRYISTATK